MTAAAMSNSGPAYVTIPDDDFGWLAAVLNIRYALAEAAALGVAILEAAGAEATP
jgi:hypothetical protein